MNAHTPQVQAGSSMIEVLVTLVILLIGLLGLAGVMVQGQRSEMESYQRVQALILLQDMVGRINANRIAAPCYNFTSAVSGVPYLGTVATYVPVCTTAQIIAVYPTLAAASAAAPAATAISDMTAWSAALNGAAETSGGANIGAMVGARGCVSYDATTALIDSLGAAIAGTGKYTVSVAWQGLGDTFANTSLLCGQGQYGNEAQRRVVSLPLVVGAISNTN